MVVDLVAAELDRAHERIAGTDGLRIVAAAMEGGCDRAHLAAGERSAQVALTLSVVTPVPRGAGCPAVARGVTLSTTLHRPLWGRRLTDAATGRPVRYFDGRRLFRVGYLPTGYRFARDTPTSIDSAMPTSAPVAWTRVYQGPHGMTLVYVTQVPQPGEPAATLPVTGRSEIGGHPASFRAVPEPGTGTDFSRAITWSAAGEGVAVLSQPVSASGSPLPFSVLKMIASSLGPLP